MKTILLTIIVGALVCGCFSRLDCAAQNNSRIPTLNKEQWRQDLQYLARELPKRHKNLFHTVSREQFERSVAELDTAIPSLQDHQIVVRMMQITAMVGDGHTGVHMPPYFKLLPLALYWFGNELRVTGTQKEYERALGARVVKVGAFSIDDVQARIRSCLPSAENENEWYVMSSSPSFITRSEILHALGVVPDPERVPITFADEQGKQFTLEIVPFMPPPAVKGAIALPGALPAAKVQPLFRQKPAESFWFTHLPDLQTTYVNFRRYDSLGEHSRALFAFIDRHQPKRLVIDLRQNGGGDFFEGRKHLIRPIKERPALNQKGRLFVIVGRRTYSAAMANAIDFKKETNAILVGEPIGERPNSYSENDEMTLPNSRIVVSYSTRYYKFLDEDVPAVMPDKRIDPNWPDFKAGRDAVMDWILSQSH